MEYISVQEAAKKWNISDRRVRVLCSEGKIADVIKKGKSYRIPENADKPRDGREKKSVPSRFLKWENEIIATIDTTNSVTFIKPKYNNIVSLYTNGNNKQSSVVWTSEQFIEFLSERVVNRDRRDIEKILFRCGLSQYDVLKISEITRSIHPKDLLWISNSETETFESIMTDVFQSIFIQKIDQKGDSIDTPEGYNIKRYGVYNGQYGIYKQRISPLTTDAESEVAVYLLAKRLGIPCCPAYKTGKDEIFSSFLYDFSKEYIIHFRRLFDGKRGNNEYQNLLSVRPEYKEDIARMILLDFITRQDDRHLSNIAIKVNKESESFYPLYDNGRSLFYEDTEEMVAEAVANPELYSTSFGFSGTYWDYVQEVAKERKQISNLIDLSTTKDEISNILKEAGFTGYRYTGSLEWISKALEMIKNLEAK